MASEDEHDGGSSHGDFEEDSMVLKILIAATAAGSIIGKGGSTINEFQETSGARIQLSRNGETFPGTTDRVISLGGGVADIVGAVHLMIQKLTQDGAELVEGEPRVRVVVPNASCGAVIGKGGATIRRFQEDSGANIKLSSQDRMLPGVTDRVLTVTGDAANVLRAIANVVAALSEAFFDSKWCAAEIDAAREAGIKVVPCFSGEDYPVKQIDKWVKEYKRHEAFGHVFKEKAHDVLNKQNPKSAAETLKYLATRI